MVNSCRFCIAGAFSRHERRGIGLLTVSAEVSEIIDRPVADVFRIYAHDHVQNHPRWDPDMELEQVTEGPIGVGTRIRRRHTRGGTTVEGVMEVVEYVPDHAFGLIIRDGPVEMRGRATLEASDQNRTKVTMTVELRGADEVIDEDVFTRQMKQALENIKKFIESES